jgi:osmotically inducible protein OsmC
VDTTINLHHAGGTEFFLSARLDVSIPGVDRAMALELVEAAHGICPYSKAVRGNIEVEANLI